VYDAVDIQIGTTEIKEEEKKKKCERCKKKSLKILI